MRKPEGLDVWKIGGLADEEKKKVPEDKMDTQNQREIYEKNVISKAWPAAEGHYGVLNRLGRRNRRMGEIIHEDAITEDENRGKAAQA